MLICRVAVAMMLFVFFWISCTCTSPHINRFYYIMEGINEFVERLAHCFRVLINITFETVRMNLENIEFTANSENRN
jgi:bacteriorhodopsin